MAGEELEVWAALEVEAETELEGQLAEAAWEAAWVRKPGASLQVELQEVLLRVEDPEGGQLVWSGHWAQVVGLQGGYLE